MNTFLRMVLTPPSNLSIVVNMLLWKNPAQSGKIVGVLNLFFLLMIVYNYSLLSLLLLFVFFIALAGMALNLIYLSSREERYLQTILIML
jgi:hypothetical protein